MRQEDALLIAREVARAYGRRAVPKIIIRRSAVKPHTSGHCCSGERYVWERMTTACHVCRGPQGRSWRTTHNGTCWRRAFAPGSFERARITVTLGKKDVQHVPVLLHELAHALVPGEGHGYLWLRRNRELSDLWQVEPIGESKAKNAIRRYEREGGK